jgi:hypothetical protein
LFLISPSQIKRRCNRSACIRRLSFNVCSSGLNFWYLWRIWLCAVTTSHPFGVSTIGFYRLFDLAESASAGHRGPLTALAADRHQWQQRPSARSQNTPRRPGLGVSVCRPHPSWNGGKHAADDRHPRQRFRLRSGGLFHTRGSSTFCRIAPTAAFQDCRKVTAADFFISIRY